MEDQSRTAEVFLLYLNLRRRKKGERMGSDYRLHPGGT